MPRPSVYLTGRNRHRECSYLEAGIGWTWTSGRGREWLYPVALMLNWRPRTPFACIERCGSSDEPWLLYGLHLGPFSAWLSLPRWLRRALGQP